jgi:hypothetical protein
VILDTHDLRRQMNPRQSKEIQTKRLGFPWIPLAELGLFNGLRRFQMKIAFPFILRLSDPFSLAFFRFLPSEILASILIFSNHLLWLKAPIFQSGRDCAS